MKKQILSNEDIVRLRSKYPDKKKPVKSMKFGDYKSLSSAVSDPSLPVIRSFDGTTVLVVRPNSYVKKSQWTSMAWAQVYRGVRPTLFWNGFLCGVVEYVVTRYPTQSIEMLSLWDKLIALVPDEESPKPIPTNEELEIQWQEFMKGAQ